MSIKHLQLPLKQDEIDSLEAGDILYLTGAMYTARDAAHKRMVEAIKNNNCPIPLQDTTIYYVGPTPARPNEVIGSAGPTSSYRMDPYVEDLLKQGLKIMIGKGPRSENYKELLKEYHALYLTCIGGAAVSISKTIKNCELIAYPELGPEAIYRLEVEDFFAIVTYDVHGGDLYRSGVNQYKKTS